MKIKSVLAAVIAAAAISCTGVCAFADGTETVDEIETSSVPESVTVAADPMDGTPVSGVDGAAALAGIAMVAGAALVISHRHG